MDDQIITKEMLQQIGNIVRAKAVELAPTHLKDKIQLDDIVSVSPTGQIGIAVRINMAKTGAKDARAQEYGSGLQATRGPRQTYRIQSKSGKLLAFSWDVISDSQAYLMAKGGSKKIAGASQGTKFFRYVDHPGIAPYKERGYMHPALVASQSEITNIIGKSALENVRLKIRAKFTRPGGHG